MSARRPPYTVQVMTRGGWASDATSRRLDRMIDRMRWLTRSPRGRVPARVIDRDGRTAAQ